MAKLPPIDVEAFWILDLLHRGRREEALSRIEALGERAGPKTRELAVYLRTAKRGRQPFGAKHLWYDIGRDNDEMREDGKSHQERMSELGRKYNMADESKLKTAIARYERAMDDARSIEEEGRG